MSTQAASNIHVLTLGDLRTPIERSGRLRALCPVHGGDRQRSISVQLEGEYAGFGYCHNCHAVVLVADLNPEAASRVTGKRYDAQLYKPVSLPSPESSEWQQNELKVLKSRYGAARKALRRERSVSYLEQRGIPIDLAEALGVGYIPAIPWDQLTDDLMAIAKWHDRLIFPLSKGGFSGRTLRLWQPGMDENEHKQVLDEYNTRLQDGDDKKRRYPINRWEKTNPAGYFHAEVLKTCKQVTFVEGPMDACALIAGGVLDVLATCGTSLDVSTIPVRICDATLAYDGDEKGKKATTEVCKILRRKGITSRVCAPPDDGQGKDWSERYRLHSIAGLMPLFRCVIGTCTQPVVYRDVALNWWCADHERIANYGSSNGSETCSQCDGSDVVDVDDDGKPLCALHSPGLEVKR